MPFPPEQLNGWIDIEHSTSRLFKENQQRSTQTTVKGGVQGSILTFVEPLVLCVEALQVHSDPESLC